MRANSAASRRGEQKPSAHAWVQWTESYHQGGGGGRLLLITPRSHHNKWPSHVFMPRGCRKHWEMKPVENKGRDNTLDPHYNPAIKPSLVYLQCQSAQWLKLMEINPKQINFPRAPHPGSQLPWISNVVACSEIKVMTRRQGRIKDTRFKATFSPLRCSLVTSDIHISHTR